MALMDIYLCLPLRDFKIGVVNNARVPLSHKPNLVLGFKIALSRESADLRMHKRRQNTRTHEFPVWVSGSFCVVEKNKTNVMRETSTKEI